jgi:hypothetical protein
MTTMPATSPAMTELLDRVIRRGLTLPHGADRPAWQGCSMT